MIILLPMQSVHVYHHYFVSDDTSCPNCTGPLEDNNHCLLICPKFNSLRMILLDSIQTLIQKNNNIDINIDLLLHGNSSFSYDLRTEIFQAVHKFIIDSSFHFTSNA